MVRVTHPLRMAEVTSWSSFESNSPMKLKLWYDLWNAVGWKGLIYA